MCPHSATTPACVGDDGQKPLKEEILWHHYTQILFLLEKQPFHFLQKKAARGLRGMSRLSHCRALEPLPPHG